MVAPASVGDYVAGPNHVLPTVRLGPVRRARCAVDDFRKHMHVVTVDEPALAERRRPTWSRSPTAEGLAGPRRVDRASASGGPRMTAPDRAPATDVAL